MAGTLNAETFSASQGSFAILRQPIDARSAGMGRAYGAVASGADALWWNPAGLGYGKSAAVSAGYQSFYDGISLQQLSLYSGAGKLGGFGLSVMNVSAGTFESRDANGQLLDNGIEPKIYGLRLGFGKWLSSISTSLGVELGYLNQNLGVVSNSGFEGNFGATWAVGRLRLSTGMREIMDPVAPEALGSEVFAAGAWNIPVASKNILAAVDAHFPSQGEVSYNLGLEFLTSIGLAIRSGYGTRGDSAILGWANGFSLGAGFAFKKFQLDYGWTTNDIFGAQHSLSLRYDFNLYGAPAPAAVPLKPEHLLEEARTLNGQKKSNEAVQKYLRYLKLVPNSIQGWLELAKIYLDAGEIENANSCFERVRALK